MELSEEQKKALEQQKANCPFCKIIKGETDSKKVYEDDLVIAVLDINPAVKGHILLMPKEHYPITPLIPPQTFSHMFKMVQKLSDVMKKALLVPATTVFVANGAAAGQQSQHFLLHIVPREEKDNLSNFDLPKGEVEEEKAEELQKMLTNNLPIMLNNHLQRVPTRGVKIKTKPGAQEQVQQKFSKEQIVQIIEQNPQLKQMIETQPEVFKEQAKVHPQLQTIFKDVDVDEIIEHFGGKKSKKGKKTKKKNDGDVDLDSISDLL